MPLKSIPVLDSTYPLYDWTNWQSSRDALVTGTPTKYFAKEAWNAIIDKLNNALKAAGLSWDDTYTTVANAKVKTAYGTLSAKMFNSVRHNIDIPAPLGWAWARNESFRGYVGREDFRGRQDFGKECDLLYPEYIIELVRKLNLLIEIMRGTAPIQYGEALHSARLLVTEHAVARPSITLSPAHLATLSEITGIVSRPSVPIALVYRTAPLCDLRLRTTLSKPLLGLYMFSTSNLGASGRVRESRVISPEGVMPLVLSRGDLVARRFLHTKGNHSAVSRSSSTMRVALPLPSSGSCTATTTISRPEALCREALPTSGCSESFSVSASHAVAKLGHAFTADAIAPVLTQSELSYRDAVALEAKKSSTTKASSYLDTAWYPPIWVSGGLWIRQSHEFYTNENGELVIT